MYVWMEVTQDELELPVAIADTPQLLARKVGVSVENVRASDRYGELYKKKRSRFVKVEVDNFDLWDDEDDEDGECYD